MIDTYKKETAGGVFVISAEVGTNAARTLESLGYVRQETHEEKHRTAQKAKKRELLDAFLATRKSNAAEDEQI